MRVDIELPGKRVWLDTLAQGSRLLSERASIRGANANSLSIVPAGGR